MKFTYRGNTYERFTPTQSDSIEQPKIKLIYRGQTYYTTPRPVVAPEVDTTGWETVTLIYRGSTYERKLQPLQPYQQPTAMNWRYQNLKES